MLGTAASLLSHTKNKRDKNHWSVCQDCWRNPQNCWEEKGNIVIARERRRKGQRQPRRRADVSTPHCTNLLLSTKNCKREEPAEGTLPRIILPPGAVAGLGLNHPKGLGSASQDRNNPSPTGPGKAAAAGRDGGVQGQRQGGREDQLPARSTALSPNSRPKSLQNSHSSRSVSS